MTTHPDEQIPEWTVGDRLRKARELVGLGQREFAEEIGVSKQTVTNAEKGHRSVRSITMKMWSVRTGVPLPWLETGAGTANAPDPGDGDTSRLSQLTEAKTKRSRAAGHTHR